MAINDKTMVFNENQKRLLVFLINGVHCKRDMIKKIWREKCLRIRDNNFSQLLFPISVRFNQHKLPKKILTMLNFGVKLNGTLIGHVNKESNINVDGVDIVQSTIREVKRSSQEPAVQFRHTIAHV
jgi:hypothetical protein